MQDGPVQVTSSQQVLGKLSRKNICTPLRRAQQGSISKELMIELTQQSLTWKRLSGTYKLVLQQASAELQQGVFDCIKRSLTSWI